jgi:hypothetical protein
VVPPVVSVRAATLVRTALGLGLSLGLSLGLTREFGSLRAYSFFVAVISRNNPQRRPNLRTSAVGKSFHPSR